MVEEINEKSGGEEEVELYTEEIPKQFFDEIVKQENVLPYKNLISPTIKGGKIYGGSGDKCFRFEGDKGIWLGNADFDSAPFKVDMDGNVTLSGYIQVGGAAADVNAGATTIDGGKITTNSIAADKIISIGASKLDSTVISGGKIVTSLLTADNIQTGTLTGRTVRTSSGITRVELQANDNTLSVYQDGNRRVVIGSGVVSFLTPSEVGSGEIYGLGTNQLGFNVSGSGDYAMDGSAFYPLASGKDLGLSSYYRFNNLYLSGYINAEGLIQGGSLNITGGGTNYIQSNLVISGELQNCYNLKFNSSYGKIYHGTTEILDFSATKLACKKPFGFQVRSGPPGAASSFKGYMYFDTDQNDLVFSNGTNWHKVNATQI